MEVRGAVRGGGLLRSCKPKMMQPRRVCSYLQAEPALSLGTLASLHCHCSFWVPGMSECASTCENCGTSWQWSFWRHHPPPRARSPSRVSEVQESKQLLSLLSQESRSAHLLCSLSDGQGEPHALDSYMELQGFFSSSTWNTARFFHVHNWPRPRWLPFFFLAEYVIPYQQSIAQPYTAVVCSV